MGIVCSKTIKVRYGSHPADVRLSAVGLDLQIQTNITIKYIHWNGLAATASGCRPCGASRGVAPGLYTVVDQLERHLCEVTDNLFNQSYNIVLFELTYFCFEGC